MKIKKERAILIVIIIGVLMTVFSSALTTMLYRKMQTDSYVHTGKIYCVGVVRKINYALSFGKTLDKYYGLDELLSSLPDISSDILGAQVIDDDGNVIETVGEIPETPARSRSGEEYVLRNSGIYIFVSLDSGTLILRLDNTRIKELTMSYTRYISFFALLIMALIAIMSLAAFSFRFPYGIVTARVRVTAIFILIIAQTALGGAAMYKLDSSYRVSVDQIAKSVAGMVESDLNEVIEKGIDYDEITGIDEYLKDLSDDVPELSDLKIESSSTGRGQGNSGYRLDLEEEEWKDLYFYCNYDYDRDNIIKNRVNNVIEVLILILISVFITLEAVNFMASHMEGKGLRQKGVLYIPGFRLFVFVEGIAFALDAGFFSVYSTKMFDAMELPDNMSFLSGLPNTMYSAAVLAGLLGCSYLISRFGMRNVMTVGLCAGIIGYVLCALSPNLPILIAARFIYGFCDGIIINSIRIFASSQKNPVMHKKILVEYMSTVNLGVCCGVVVGGLLADASSYNTVFLTGAVLGIICLMLIYLAGFPEKQEGAAKMSLFNALRELKSPRVLIFMFFIVVPLYFSTLFVGYTFPIFGDEAGLSNSMVSGCLMINFIILAYFTEPISERVLKVLKPQKAMLLYLISQIVSIGIFVVTGTVWGALLALILNSLCDCFGMVALDMGPAHEEGKTTESYTLLQMVFGKLGLIIGPLAITSQLGKGATGATGVIIAVLAAGMVIYMISMFAFKEKRNEA